MTHLKSPQTTPTAVTTQRQLASSNHSQGKLENNRKFESQTGKSRQYLLRAGVGGLYSKELEKDQQ